MTHLAGPLIDQKRIFQTIFKEVHNAMIYAESFEQNSSLIVLRFLHIVYTKFMTPLAGAFWL